MQMDTKDLTNLPKDNTKKVAKKREFTPEETEFLSQVGEQIATIRKKRKITQKALADHCEFDRSNMRRIEAGRTNPTLLNLEKIAEGLDVPLFELLQFENKRKVKK